MAVLSASGMSIGIDGSSIIKQLVAIQSRPLQDIRQQQSKIEAQISAYGKLRSAISTFESAMSKLASQYDNAFKSLSAVSSNEDAFTATAASTATAGSHAVNVIGLAYAHKKASSAYVDSATDIGGTGSLDITVNGNTSNITVAAGSTLADIRDAINNAVDNPGVTASIVNESLGSRLILTSKETGAANTITITVNDDDAVTGDFSGLSKLFDVGDGATDAFAREITAAADATLEVDGFTVNSASNTVTGVIEGVSFQLKGAGNGTLTISQDDSAITEAAQNFADAYNELRDTITSMYKGDLKRDPTLRMMEQNLLSIVGATTAAGTYTHISQVGLTRDKEGTMSLNSSDLTAALANDFDSVAALFTDATNGIAVRLEAFADQLAGADGLIKSREDGLDSRMSSLKNQESRWELRILDMEARYKRQFAAMDATVSALQGSSNYLASQMTSLIG